MFFLRSYSAHFFVYIFAFSQWDGLFTRNFGDFLYETANREKVYYGGFIIISSDLNVSFSFDCWYKRFCLDIGVKVISQEKKLNLQNDWSPWFKENIKNG